MSSELMDTFVWPDGMGPQVQQVWVRLLAHVLVPIHATMRHTGVHDFSDVVNRAAVLERTDSDSLPIQDLTSRILMLAERTSNLEVCVLEARVPSGEASFSAASRSSRAEHPAPSLIIQAAPADAQQYCPHCRLELSEGFGTVRCADCGLVAHRECTIGCFVCLQPVNLYMVQLLA